MRRARSTRTVAGWLAAVAVLSSTIGVATPSREAAADAAPRPWKQFHADAARTGYAPGASTIGSTPPILASLAVGGPISASPVLTDLDGDGRLDIVASADSPELGARARVRAFRQVPGSYATAWSFEIPVSFSSNAFRGWASVAAGDLDGDGGDEVVVYSNYEALGQTDGRLWVLDGRTGSVRASFTSAFIGTGLRAPPAIGDVTGDGAPDIVVVRATRDAVPRTMLFGAGFTGVALVKHFDTELGTRAVTAAPALAELRSSHPGLEIVVGDGGDSNGVATVWLCAPNSLGARCTESTTVNNGVRGIAVGDLDGDARGEIVVNARTDASLFVIKGTANPLGGTSNVAASNDGYLWSTPSIADVDGDLQADVVNVGHSEFVTDAEKRGDVTVRGFDGSAVVKKGTLERPAPPGGSTRAPGGGALADLSGDGVPELVFGSDDGSMHAVTVKNAHETAPARPAWSLPMPARPSSPVAIADVTGDGRLDVVVGLEDGTVTVAGVRVVVASEPLGLSATAGDQEVVLSWSPPASDGGASIRRYEIHRRTATGELQKIAETSAAGLGFVDTTAVNGTTYGYRVAAVNASGTGALSAEATATPFSSGAPAVEVSPSALGFGDQRVGSTSGARAITVRSAGTARLRVPSMTLAGFDPTEFAVVGDTCTGARLSPGASCSVSLSFTPTVALDRSASLRIQTNASADPVSVALTGRGVEPIARVSTSALGFGSIDVGSQSAPQSVAVSNLGTAPLIVQSAVTTGDFAVSGDACTGTSVTPGSSCLIQVVFAPSAAGARAGSLRIATDAAGSPHTVAMSGIGVGVPGISVSPTILSFETTPVGGISAQRGVTVRNSGTAPVTIGTVSLSGANPADFFITSNGCNGRTLAIDGACSVSVAFRPTTGGAPTATLSIPHDGPGSPRTVALDGVGFSGTTTATVAPSVVDYGTMWVGGSTTNKVITITAGRDGPLAITSVPISGEAAADFVRVFDGCSGKTLTAGGWCSLQVRFVPRDAGQRTAVVAFNTNASGSPHLVGLTGSGAHDVAPPASRFTTADLGVVVFPTGEIAGTVSDDLSGVASVTVTWSGVHGPPRSAEASLTCDASRRLCTWRVPAPLAPGPLTVTARATDRRGNVESPGPSITVIVV